MRTVLRLKDSCGEFCTARTHPALPELRSQIESQVDVGGDVLIDRSGIKSFTVSFLDELLGPLLARRTIEDVTARVTFTPPLEDFLEAQLARSRRLRTES